MHDCILVLIGMVSEAFSLSHCRTHIQKRLSFSLSLSLSLFVIVYLSVCLSQAQTYTHACMHARTYNNHELSSILELQADHLKIKEGCDGLMQEFTASDQFLMSTDVYVARF